LFRRGRLVRVEHRRCDRLAIALLSGVHRDVHHERQSAVSRRHYREKLKAYDDERAEERRKAEAIWAEHQAILDRIEQDRLERRPRLDPRVRRL
jgi:hypothetical protein